MERHPEYLSAKVKDKDIITTVSRIVGNEIWNITYAEVFEIMARNGYIIWVEPVSGARKIEYAPQVVKFDPNDNGSINHILTDISYQETWAKAAASAIFGAMSDYLAKSDRPTETKPTVEKFEKTEQKQVKSRHSLDHPMYARHSEEDPYPFE